MKSLMLGVVSFLLACFVAFLLFIASNQYALMKVHELICSKPHIKHIATINKVENVFRHRNMIDAAIKPTGVNNSRKGEKSTDVARNTTHISNNDKMAIQQIPQYTSALGSAQSLVNRNNHKHNRYNDYAIDKNYKGKYYYIFTFENAQQQGKYYRVTVDSNNKPNIFDSSFKPNAVKDQNVNVSTQEMSVIAQKYAQDQLSSQSTLQHMSRIPGGMTYLFVDSQKNKQLKVNVNKSGKVFNSPIL